VELTWVTGLILRQYTHLQLFISVLTGLRTSLSLPLSRPSCVRAFPVAIVLSLYDIILLLGMTVTDW